MACSFAYLEDSCGCLIGYQLPLKTAENEDITNYPVNVLNVNEVDLGEAASPSAYVTLWNTDTANQAVGVLSVGTGGFCFHLSYIKDADFPSRVLGDLNEEGGEGEGGEGNRFAQIGFSDLDTTGEPHTEGEYVISIDNALPTPTQKSVTPGNLVATPAEFGNVTDKVLFVVVDPTMPVYTKWSVLGDPLQQNQPIDAAFNLASGNVMFKASYGSGYLIYATYLQTTFGNNLILS